MQIKITTTIGGAVILTVILVLAATPVAAQSSGHGNGWGNGAIGNGHGNGYGNGPDAGLCPGLHWIEKALGPSASAGMPELGRVDCGSGASGQGSGRGNVGADNGMFNGLGNIPDQDTRGRAAPSNE